MNIGKVIKEELNRKNMRVSELSKITNIPAQTLYAIIKRNSTRIKIDTIQKISNALEIPITTFFDNSPLNIISDELVNNFKEHCGNVLNSEEIKLLLSCERCIEILILGLGNDLIYDDNDNIYYLIKDNKAYKLDYDDIERIQAKIFSYLKYLLFELIEDKELEEIEINNLKDIQENSGSY